MGVLKAITRLLPKKEHSYDVVTGNSIFTLGTSLGSMNAFIMGMYRLGEEAKATQDLEKFWRKLIDYPILLLY